MPRVFLIMLGLFHTVVASTPTLKYWKGQTCSRISSSGEVKFECEHYGKCQEELKKKDLMFNIGRFSDGDTGFLLWDGWDHDYKCPEGQADTVLRFTPPEYEQLMQGKCTYGYLYEAGKDPKNPENIRAQLDAAFDATCGCHSCAKRAIKRRRIIPNCRNGSQDATKQILEKYVANIGTKMVETISAELDAAILPSLADMTVEDSCNLCILGISDFVVEDSSEYCPASESCEDKLVAFNSIKKIAARNRICERFAEAPPRRATTNIIVTVSSCNVANAMVTKREVNEAFSAALKKGMPSAGSVEASLQAPGCKVSGGRRLQNADIQAGFVIVTKGGAGMASLQLPPPAVFQKNLKEELPEQFANESLTVGTFSSLVAVEETAASCKTVPAAFFILAMFAAQL